MGYQISGKRVKLVTKVSQPKNTEGVYMFAFFPNFPRCFLNAISNNAVGAMTIAELEENVFLLFLFHFQPAENQYYNALAQQESGELCFRTERSML